MKLAEIFKRVDRIEEKRAKLRAWEEEEIAKTEVTPPPPDLRGAVLSVAAAPSVPSPAQIEIKACLKSPSTPNYNQVSGVMNLDSTT